MKNLFLTAVLSATMAVPALADTIRLGTEGAYPPYNFVNDQGEVDGFERELGDELCKRAKLECVWVTNDWDTIIPNLVSGNYDAIMAGMSITAERDKVIDFTQGYTQPAPSLYVVNKGTDLDVKTAVVGAQTNTIQASHVASSGATLVEFATADETMAALKNGEVDAVLSEKDVVDPIIAASGGTLETKGKVLIGGGTGMGIRESDGELKAKMDAAISSMKADGSLNKMLVKWFGKETDLF